MAEAAAAVAANAQAQAGGESPAEGGPSVDATAAPAKPKAAAPGKTPAVPKAPAAPREVLPGVIPDREFNPSLPEGDALEADASGATDETVEQDPNAEQEGEPAEKFAFAGQEWESQQQAEQSFRTLRGMHKSMQTKLAAAEKYGREHYQKVMDWKAAYERDIQGGPSRQGNQSPDAGGQRNGGSNGAAQASVNPAAADTPKGIIDSLDWRTIHQMAESEGMTVALYEALDQVVPRLQELFDRKVNDSTKDYREQQAEAAQVKGAIDLFTSMAAYVDDDGATPVYPELHQGEEAVAEVVRFWSQMGFPSDAYALSPAGVHLAILAYRHWKRRTDGSTKPTAANGSPSAAAAAAIKSVKEAAGLGAGATASTTVSGSSGSPVRPASPAQAGEASLRRQILNAGVSKTHQGLGFLP